MKTTERRGKKSATIAHTVCTRLKYGIKKHNTDQSSENNGDNDKCAQHKYEFEAKQ